MIGDLHCHSRISDGSTGLETLVRLAQRLEIGALAVTDHDTMAGCTRADVLGKRYGVKIIHGVEFSAFDTKRGRKAHILCYRTRIPERLQGLCYRTNESRRRAALEMIHRVTRLYPILSDEILRRASASITIFKPHIMEALMDAGYETAVYGALYDTLFHQKTGSCLVEPKYPDVFEVLESIRMAGGIAVLAHPETYDSMDLLPELIEAGLHGVEVWHPRNSEPIREKLLTYVKENHLLATGGSDFHGMYRKYPTVLGACVTPPEHLEALLSFSTGS